MKRGASLFVLCLASPSLAMADEAARVVLLLPACELPGANASELRRAVALDLQAEGVALAPPGELSPGSDVELLIEATCPAPEDLTLRAEQGAVRHSRHFQLSELPPDQRTRALSLALSELVSLVRNPPPSAADPEAPRPAATELAPTAPTPVAPSTPTPVAPSQPKRPTPAPLAALTPQGEFIPAPRPHFRLGLSPQARFFDGTRLWGGELWLAHSRLRYAADLLLARSTAAAGTIRTLLVHASAGYSVPLLESTGGSVFQTGPRLGFGHTFMSAQPTADVAGHDAHDWYLDGAWGARYSGRVSKTIMLGFGAELGYARGPIGYADDLVVARTSGAFASLTLDGSFAL